MKPYSDQQDAVGKKIPNKNSFLHYFNSSQLFSKIQNFSLIFSLDTDIKSEISEQEIKNVKDIFTYTISSIYDFIYVIFSKNKINLSFNNSNKIHKQIETFILILSNFIFLIPTDELKYIYKIYGFNYSLFEPNQIITKLIIKLVENSFIDISQCEFIIRFNILFMEYYHLNVEHDFIIYRDSFSKGASLIIRLVQSKVNENDNKIIQKLNSLIQNVISFYNSKILENIHLKYSLSKKSEFLRLLNIGKYIIINKETNKVIIDFLIQLYIYQFSQNHLGFFFSFTKNAFINKPIMPGTSPFSQMHNFIHFLNSLSHNQKYDNDYMIKEGYIFCDQYKNNNCIIIRNLNLEKELTFIFSFNCIKTKKNQINTLFSFYSKDKKKGIFNLYINQAYQLCLTIPSKYLSKDTIINSFQFEDNKNYLIYFQMEKSEHITIYVDNKKICDQKGSRIDLENTYLFIGFTIKDGEHCDRFNGTFGNLLIYNQKFKDNIREFIMQLKYDYYLLAEVPTKSFTEIGKFNSSKEYMTNISFIIEFIQKGDINLSSILFTLTPDLSITLPLKKGKNIFKIKNTRLKVNNNTFSYPIIEFPSKPLPEYTSVFSFKSLNFYEEFMNYEGFTYIIMVLEFYYISLYENNNNTIDFIDEILEGIEQIVDLLNALAQNIQITLKSRDNFDRIFFSLGKIVHIVSSLFIILILVIIGKD